MTVNIHFQKRTGAWVTLFLGLLSLYEAHKLYQYGGDLLSGDHTFPGLIGILLVFLGISLLFDRKEDTRNQESTSKRARFASIVSISLLLVYCFLMTVVGYVISTLAVATCLFKVIGNYKWRMSVIIGAITTAILYFLFIVLLKIPLPAGIRM